MYDSKDLVTHAVCVGMTGSGKTGLCVGLIEEAAIDGIPSIVIDPKGDLSNLLLTNPAPISMTATIQKELADRIVAPPGTKDYSALSIWMQSLCDIEIVREMPPQVFWPRPKVHSAIIHIVPDRVKREQLGDLAFFHDFVRSLFFHRRKFLRGVLAGAFDDRLTKPQIDEILSPFGLPADARAEQLDVTTLIALSKAIQQRLAG